MRPYLMKIRAPSGANTALTLSPGTSVPLTVTRRRVHRSGFSQSGNGVSGRPANVNAVPPSLNAGV